MSAILLLVLVLVLLLICQIDRRKQKANKAYRSNKHATKLLYHVL